MDPIQSLTDRLSALGISPPLALLGAAAVAGVLVFLRIMGAARRRAEEAERMRESERRMAELLRAQSEMQGRLAAMADVLARRQEELGRAVGGRLDGMAQRLTETLAEQTRSTHENLRSLQERLAVIDHAQNNIQALAKDVVGLQAILANKQTRGAFGQGRMEAIVADGLPMGAYEFQATLSNGSRPDCIIRMPNGQPPLVIDAKFPLEAWNAMRQTEGEEARLAAGRFRRDMEVHVRDISEKYLIRGETQEVAFMFVPSESIFADLHEHFEPVIQRAQRSRVVIVSPSLLMLSIQVLQGVLKDQRMREQAHLIQGEVARLMEDLGRLDERVRKLQSHFFAAQKDVEMIAQSSDKISRRGQKIEAMDFADLSSAAAPPPTVESRTGQLRLKVVDED